ncbi:hypothetical protein Anapl_11869 [Anas platyrhynchos]|uniref:Uncharacterized protein n=1 Tax=Anas platyrhynchos TaxID=8839 RepID=R0KDY6_ANAPL|nr:hypothetical protein Anapl_11869 [Anas platyrhynchos]
MSGQRERDLCVLLYAVPEPLPCLGSQSGSVWECTFTLLIAYELGGQSAIEKNEVTGIFLHHQVEVVGMQRDKQEKRNNGVLLLPSLRIVASRCWKKVTGAHLASKEVPSCNKVQKPNIHNDFGFG